jgi:hypothetical protein
MGNSLHKGLTAEERAVLLAGKAERDRALENALYASGAGRNHFARVITTLCADPRASLDRALPRDRTIQQEFIQLEAPRSRKVFADLLLHLDAEGCENLIAHAPYLHGIAQLARQSKHFIRPPTEWSRPGRNMHRQFSSFIRHCLTRYHVPQFMDQCWSEPDAHFPRQWFRDIGNGRSIRQSEGLPFILTKRMAHEFLHAPHDLRIEEALRWAQVTGAYGSEALAREVICSRIGRNGFAHEDYWGRVVQFFVAHPLPIPGKLGEVVDMLAHRFEADGPIDLGGRTAASIIRLSDQWHREVARASGTVADRRWARCTLMEGSYTTGKAHEKLSWKVVELLSLQDLVNEGRALQHCVATYDRACSKRTTAIFSIRTEDIIGNVERWGTIEVHLHTSRVVQAKAKRNTQLKPSARAILEKWAYREGLRINEQL